MLAFALLLAAGPVLQMADQQIDQAIAEAHRLPAIGDRVEKLSALAIPRLFAGTLHRAHGVRMLRGKHVEIRRSAAGPAHVDGEPLMLPAILTIEIVPRSLHVLVPDRATAL